MSLHCKEETLYAKFCSVVKKKTSEIFVPTTLEGGGTIYSNGFFFVQTILADRFNNRRELRLVSLESPSSIEYGNKKYFFKF